jgi:hypothetical protein
MSKARKVFQVLGIANAAAAAINAGAAIAQPELAPKTVPPAIKCAASAGMCKAMDEDLARGEQEEQ